MWQIYLERLPSPRPGSLLAWPTAASRSGRRTAGRCPAGPDLSWCPSRWGRPRRSRWSPWRKPRIITLSIKFLLDLYEPTRGDGWQESCELCTVFNQINPALTGLLGTTENTEPWVIITTGGAWLGNFTSWGLLWAVSWCVLLHNRRSILKSKMR